MNYHADFNVGIFHNELKRFVYKQTRDKSLAEDIVQDVFLKARNSADQLRDAKKATSWVYQIARNAIIDHYRKRSRGIELLQDTDNEEPNYNECAAQCLKELIPSLPEKYRVPFQLAEIDKLSQTSLTQELGLTYSGVKSRVQRARKMLKERLRETYIIETDAYGNVIVCQDR